MSRVLALVLSVASVRIACAQNVLTGNYDNARTNANLNETILTPDTVSSSRFGRLFALPVDGQIYAQPLYQQNVTVPGRGTHNVVFVATAHNSVYAWDADAPAAPLWTVNLGPSVPSNAFDSADNAYTDVYPEIGILGTPVIDASTGTLYVVAATRESGTCYYRLHALDVRSGSERFGAPVLITAGVPGVGDGSERGSVSFTAAQHLQRPALLLLNGIVYAGFGSHGDSAPWHGWILGYRADNVQKQAVIFNPTPNGSGGSVWQSGRGLASDDAGSIYAVTSNGDSDEVSSYSDNVLRLTPGSLAVADWFAPSNVQLLNTTDDDLGAAGAMLVPGANLLITGGKEGILYLLDIRSLGHLSFNNGQILQSLQVSESGIYNLALWNRSNGPVIYISNGNFTAWKLSGGQISAQPLSQSFSGTAAPFQGMAVSANGEQPGSGILWVTTADSWPLPTTGTLRAYNADDLSIELWNSTLNAAQDATGVFMKFVNPTVVNGKVYVPGTASLLVYGIADTGSGPGSGSGNAPVVTAVVNAASYANGPLAPGELVAIFGQNLGAPIPSTGSFDGNGNLPPNLSGTEITFNGVPAPMLYSSAGIATAVIPFEVAGADSVDVEAGYYGSFSSILTLPLASSAPGIFSMDGSGRGQGAVLNQDYSLNTPDNPASAGSVIMLYATGGGLTNPPGTTGTAAQSAEPLAASVSATVGGFPAEVLYAGSAPYEIEGLLQVNLRMPAAVGGKGSVAVVLTVGDSSSQSSITVAVQ